MKADGVHFLCTAKAISVQVCACMCSQPWELNRAQSVGSLVGKAIAIAISSASVTSDAKAGGEPFYSMFLIIYYIYIIF